MITLSTAQNALKNVYLEAISNQLNERIDPIFSMIKQSSDGVYGKNLIKMVPYGINGGLGAGTETGQLPDVGETKYVNFVTTLKNLYGKLEISDKAIRASLDDEGAFVNLLNSEMESLLQSSKFNLSRMFWGDGTGSLSTITAVDTTNKAMTVSNILSFLEGMVLDFYKEGVIDADMTGVTVIKVDRGTNKVYLSDISSTFTTANSNKYLCYMQGSKDLELTGLGAIFSNSLSLYGVTRADHSSIMPFSYTKANNETLNDMFVQKMMDSVELNSNIQPNVVSCGGTTLYTVINTLSSYVKNMDITNLNGGFTSVSLCGVPLIRNRFVSENKLFILNTDQFTLHQLCDWEWLTHSDGSILKQKEGYATYSATLVKYADLICNKPNAQGIVTV
ncbi:MAG: phage major capsid protein [Clostridia bacterium]|nr:phage major capsid protein [Clostridia bacterium]